MNYQNKVLNNKYQLKQELGKGSQAVVYYGTELNTNPVREIAVKIINMAFLNPKQRELLESEIHVLSVVSSRHIIKMYDHFEMDGNVFLVLEYCNGGTLDDLIKKHQSSLTDRFKKNYFKQILLAFKELHSKRVMHRDIKVQNILLHKGELKLGDFGFCKQLASIQDISITPLGTRGTMAPEILEFKSYGITAEMYSIGVVFYQISKQKFPFYGNNPISLVTAIRQGNADYSGLSEDLIDLLKKMMTYDPQQRLKWKDLLKHKFFSQDGEEMFLSSSVMLDEKEMDNYGFFYESLDNNPIEKIDEASESESSLIIDKGKNSQFAPQPQSQNGNNQPGLNNCQPVLPQALPFQNKLDNKLNGNQQINSNQRFIQFQQANFNNNNLPQQFNQNQQFKPQQDLKLQQQQQMYQQFQNPGVNQDFKPGQSGGFQWGQKQQPQFAPLAQQDINPQKSWMNDSSKDQIEYQQQQIDQLQASNQQSSNLSQKFKDAQQSYAYLLLAAKRLVSLDATCQEVDLKLSVYVFPAVMVLKEKVSIMINKIKADIQSGLYLHLKRNQPQEFKRLTSQIDVDNCYVNDYLKMICEFQYESANASQYDLFRQLIQDFILKTNPRGFEAAYPTQLKTILIDVLIDIASPGKIGNISALTDKQQVTVNKLIKEANSYLVLSCFIENNNINILQIEKNLLEGDFKKEVRQRLSTLIEEVSPKIMITDVVQAEEAQGKIYEQQQNANQNKKNNNDDDLKIIKNYSYPLKNQFLRRFQKIF